MAVDPRDVLKALGIDGTGRLTALTGAGDTSLWRVDRGLERYALRIFGPAALTHCNRERAVMLGAIVPPLESR